MRHAKAVSDHPRGDHERPLNDRGAAAAIAVGQTLVARELVPDVVACSTATRTRQTWDGVVAGGARACEVRYLELLYLASVPTLLRTVQAMPRSAGTVMVVGHSPGIPALVDFLVARTAGSRDWPRLGEYPTAGVAVLALTRPWSDVSEGCAELMDFIVPRPADPK
ncbi:MAG TPA: histidine phosphatase family protein [Propionibacteriaceae bacterium]